MLSFGGRSSYCTMRLGPPSSTWLHENQLKWKYKNKYDVLEDCFDKCRCDIFMRTIIMMMKYILGNDIHKIYRVMMFKGKTKLDQWWIRKGKWYFPAQGARLECYPPYYKIAIVQCRKRSPGPWLWGLSREKRDEEAKKRWIGSFLFAATMVAKISGPDWCNWRGEC